MYENTFMVCIIPFYYQAIMKFWKSYLLTSGIISVRIGDKDHLRQAALSHICHYNNGAFVVPSSPLRPMDMTIFNVPSTLDGFLDIFRICSINYLHIQMCLFYIRKHFESVSKRFHTYIYIYIYIYIIYIYYILYIIYYIYIFAYMRAHICICTIMHTHTFVYKYIYIHIYICIHIFFLQESDIKIITTNATEIILYYNK